MRQRITASLLVCLTGPGVAVGALALQPAAVPSPVVGAPSGHAARGVGGGTGGYGSAPGTAGGGDGAAAGLEAGDLAPADPAVANLEISGFQFSSVRVAPGATVTVHNRDSAPHTATAKDGSFDTGTLAGGATGSFIAPDVPGSYEFFCAVHPSMTGTLIVE